MVLGVFGYGEFIGAKIWDGFRGNFEVRISWAADLHSFPVGFRFISGQNLVPENDSMKTSLVCGA